MAQNKRNKHKSVPSIVRSYDEMLGEFFANGGRIVQCAPASVADDENWNSLRDYLEPYKTSPVESSRWSVGSDVAYAIRESRTADLPIDLGEE